MNTLRKVSEIKNPLSACSCPFHPCFRGSLLLVFEQPLPRKCKFLLTVVVFVQVRLSVEKMCRILSMFCCAEERAQHSALDDSTLSAIASNLVLGPWLSGRALSAKTKSAIQMVNEMAEDDIGPRADGKRITAILQLLSSENASLLGDEENTRNIIKLLTKLSDNGHSDDVGLVWRLCQDHVKADALDWQVLASCLLRNDHLLYTSLEDHFIQQLACEENIRSWSQQLISAITSNRDIFLAALEFGCSYWEELEMDPRFLNVLRGFLSEIRLSCGDNFVKLFPDEVQGLMILLLTNSEDVSLEKNPSFTLAVIESASVVRSEKRRRLVALLLLVHINLFRQLLHYSTLVGGKFHVQWLSRDFSINDISMYDGISHRFLNANFGSPDPDIVMKSKTAKSCSHHKGF